MNDATNGCEMLARIPPELFHQICLHLAAQDLLALCCASRWCNARLAAASAVWRCKWLCLGYAPPPPSVTPALVSFKALVALVTKRGCFFCSDAHTTAIDWFELARFCRRCKYASFRSRANERTAPNDGTLLTDLKGFGTWAAAVLKPRRQRSPYAFYLMEQLASVKRGNPEKTDLEARNEVRRKWESEPDELKRKYEVSAAEDKLRYKHDMMRKMSGFEQALLAAPKPKKPLSAFFLFSIDHRELVRQQHTNASFGEIGRIMGDLWRTAGPEVKEKYVRQHEREKQRFADEQVGVGQRDDAGAVAALNEGDDSVSGGERDTGR